MKNKNHDFHNVIRLGLERIEGMLELLGRPDRKLKFVHVAGTNGKGSTCAFIESALICEGKKVGKFTSPNLVSVNERICVGGKDISDSDLERVLDRAEACADEVEKVRSERPTQFEIWCAAAMLYFAEEKCDIVVLEVGLGGEFDATNIIESCELAVICRIEYDHMGYLGNTLAEIAKAKCGIIKENISTKTVVSGTQSPEALDVIKKSAEKFTHRLVCANVPSPANHSGIYEHFTYKGDTFPLSLGGTYQLENAAVAIKALEALGVSDDSIKHGLTNAVHRARFEEIDNKTIFDGGHNPDGIRALVSSAKRYFDGKKIRIIYACMADKDIKNVLLQLKEIAHEFVFTTVSDNPRAMKSSALSDFAKTECGITAKYFDNLDAARTSATDADVTIICGSLYLYQELSPRTHIACEG